ncbi:MAG: TIGR02300 family protein [Reyranellaceae bacterium]
MSKPEWGVKRTCQSCAVRFYDLKRTPIVCPKCGHKHDVEDFVKTRRTRGGAAKAPPPPPKKVVEKVVPELDAIEDVAPDDESDDDIIEDTSDLGEDGDDIPDVIETDTDEEPNT